MLLDGENVAAGSKAVGPPWFAPEGRLAYQAKVKGRRYIMIDARQVGLDLAAIDLVVAGGPTTVFAGHDPATHEVVVGKVAF